MQCCNIQDYKNLKRFTPSLKLTNSCSLSVDSWKYFHTHLPNLSQIQFKPYCRNCLELGNYFNSLEIDGRCVEKPHDKQRIDLNQITNEIAACLAFLILLTIMYLIKFIKNELLQHFRSVN